MSESETEEVKTPRKPRKKESKPRKRRCFNNDLNEVTERLGAILDEVSKTRRKGIISKLILNYL